MNSLSKRSVKKLEKPIFSKISIFRSWDDISVGRDDSEERIQWKGSASDGVCSSERPIPSGRDQRLAGLTWMRPELK
jgi:hypothetical protein